jgi:hypothetical protein
MQTDSVKRVMKAMIRAKEEEGKSVVSFQKSMIEEAVSALENPVEILTLFGVKDTNQISRDLVNRLRKQSGFVFHTIDAMSERGRAVDVERINPLTGRAMTGSSSGSCINILKGINDLAIGTDGGGSVLAPALSTQLFSILGKGMGLMGQTKKKSTDELAFVPGIGVISHDYQRCVEAMRTLCAITPEEWDVPQSEFQLAFPVAKGACLPDGRDMHAALKPYIGNLPKNVSVQTVTVPDLQDRRESIAFLNELFAQGFDAMLTLEGPIDLHGYGDSVMGVWGKAGTNGQRYSGKYLVKTANLIDATAITIPTEELATGLVLVGKPGRKAGVRLMKVADVFVDQIDRPALYQRYFMDGYQNRNLGFGSEE